VLYDADKVLAAASTADDQGLYEAQRDVFLDPSDPEVMREAEKAGIPHDWARSKSMTDFLGRPFDHVITVCDDAAEACPVFPGPAIRTHWSIPDPVGASGNAHQQHHMYRATLADLRGRITTFLATLDG